METNHQWSEKLQEYLVEYTQLFFQTQLTSENLSQLFNYKEKNDRHYYVLQCLPLFNQEYGRYYAETLRTSWLMGLWYIIHQFRGNYTEPIAQEFGRWALDQLESQLEGTEVLPYFPVERTTEYCQGVQKFLWSYLSRSLRSDQALQFPKDPD